jgi:hypothetical protein
MTSRTTTVGPTAALLLMAVLGCGAGGCSGAAISPSHDAAIGLSDGGGLDSLADGAITCTLIGCVDQFSATVTVDTNMVPAGMHVLTVTFDGAATSCPFNLPPRTDPVNDPCAAAFSLMVPGTSTDGKFTEKIVVPGAPTSIEVRQTLDGTVVLDQTISPAYQTNQPNGPGCGPTCHQASAAAWTIP